MSDTNNPINPADPPDGNGGTTTKKAFDLEPNDNPAPPVDPPDGSGGTGG